MTELAERVHQRVWDLLPWYANGSLAAAEKDMVEGHLAGCPSCRHEVESCLQLQLALRQVEEAAPSPHPVQLARLMARLDEPAASDDIDDIDELGSAAPVAAANLATPATPSMGVSEAAAAGEAGEVPVAATTTSAPLGGVAAERKRRRLARLLSATPGPVRWALAAQIVLLLGLAAMQAPRVAASLFPAPSQRPAPAYVTLSQEAPPARGPEIRIVFAEETTERQIRELLLRIGGRLADGPSPLGTYTVQIAGTGAGGAGKDSLDYVLSYLLEQPSVRFAQPVAGSVPETAAPAAGSAKEGVTH
jgi:hypothetical protein